MRKQAIRWSCPSRKREFLAGSLAGLQTRLPEGRDTGFRASTDLVYFEGDCRPTMTREPEFYFPFLPYVSVRLRF